jgi:hypothetical protein
MRGLTPALFELEIILSYLIHSMFNFTLVYNKNI